MRYILFYLSYFTSSANANEKSILYLSQRIFLCIFPHLLTHLNVMFLCVCSLLIYIISINMVHKSSRLEVFCKKGVLRSGTSLKKTLSQVFSCIFCEIFKSTFFTKRLWWMLLGTEKKKIAKHYIKYMIKSRYKDQGQEIQNNYVFTLLLQYKDTNRH